MNGGGGSKWFNDYMEPVLRLARLMSIVSLKGKQESRTAAAADEVARHGHRLTIYTPITYHWTGLLILDHPYLVENVTNSKIAETKALEPLKF
jgi:hypothetical protein